MEERPTMSNGMTAVGGNMTQSFDAHALVMGRSIETIEEEEEEPITRDLWCSQVAPW